MNYIIIGCGRVFEYYKENVLNILPKSWKLIALIESDIKKLDYLQNEFRDVSLYQNITDMLEKHNDIDVAIVLSISGKHYSHAKSFLENNINVIIEKPICMIPSEIRELEVLAQLRNKKIFSIFQNRYNKALQVTKQLIQEGDLGEIRTSRACLRWFRDDNYFVDKWRGTWQLDGGVLNNQAIHHIDAYQWLLGMPKEVFTINKTNQQKIEAEDTSISVFSFPNNSLGSFEATTLASGIDLEACLDIIGSKGYIKIGGLSLNMILDSSFHDEKTRKLNSEEFSTGYGNGHPKIFKEIINCLENDEVFSISIESVLNTSRLINSMYMSADLNTKIKISDDYEYRKLGGYS